MFAPPKQPKPPRGKPPNENHVNYSARKSARSKPKQNKTKLKNMVDQTMDSIQSSTYAKLSDYTIQLETELMRTKEENIRLKELLIEKESQLLTFMDAIHAKDKQYMKIADDQASAISSTNQSMIVSQEELLQQVVSQTINDVFKKDFISSLLNQEDPTIDNLNCPPIELNQTKDEIVTSSEYPPVFSLEAGDSSISSTLNEKLDGDVEDFIQIKKPTRLPPKKPPSYHQQSLISPTARNRLGASNGISENFFIQLDKTQKQRKSPALYVAASSCNPTNTINYMERARQNVAAAAAKEKKVDQRGQFVFKDNRLYVKINQELRLMSEYANQN